MILYFDSYITDIPLHNNFNKLRKIENSVRTKSSAYKFHTRLDVAKYTLASYASYSWSSVVIKYELQDPSLTQEFDNYIYELFPNAIVFHKRSDCQEEYAKSIKILEDLSDEWIFYAPNNDHVLINNDEHYISELIRIANQFKSAYNNKISIVYSHFSESICSIKNGHLINRVYDYNTKFVNEFENCFVNYFSTGKLDSIQILHIDLMKTWFLDTNFRKKRLIRAECLLPDITPPGQIVITPKKELCKHYDGYMHTIYSGSLIYLSPEKIPPMFIPDGFFTSTIKIIYGNSEYREGWVNINPTKKNYSFHDLSTGTDLKINKSSIPNFWKNRISVFETSDNLDNEYCDACFSEELKLLNDPWSEISSLRVKMFTSLYFLRRLRYFFIKLLSKYF